MWPAEALLPGWRETMTSYADACRTLCTRLTRLLALALDLPADFFDAPGALLSRAAQLKRILTSRTGFFDRPQVFLRLLRYSSERSDPSRGIFAAGAHSDYGMLTLLAIEDGAPGLQIQPRSDCSAADADAPWVDVPPLPGAFVVNLGDMLERWTNGRFVSTRHRVVNTSGARRHSMPFFFGAAHFIGRRAEICAEC